MRYTQLAQEERYQIHALLRAGHRPCHIAQLLGRHRSTISREIQRNTGGRGYRPIQAHGWALARRQGKSVARITARHWRTVRALIRQDWSPEQISGWLKLRRGLCISHEWIYQHILADKRQGGRLYRHLRCRKQRRKRYGSYTRRGHILGAVSIEQRPAIVDRRSRVGDWEADTIVGQCRSQAIVSLTERKTRFSVLRKVSDSTSAVVGKAMLAALGPLAERVHTITSDNGKEFAQHRRVAQRLRADFYFAHPYASWERGLNENTNGLLRQYFPKRSDFTAVTPQQVRAAMDRLNNRPRKCLGFKTPNEVFFGIEPHVAVAS